MKLTEEEYRFVQKIAYGVLIGMSAWSIVMFAVAGVIRFGMAIVGIMFK